MSFNNISNKITLLTFHFLNYAQEKQESGFKFKFVRFGVKFRISWT